MAIGHTSAAAVAGHLPAELVSSVSGANRVASDFDFLGAAVGSGAHLGAHALGRVQQADALLDAIAALQDSQVALRLLRHCAGFCRLVHTVTCCPLPPSSAALQHFDHLVQKCFSSFTGLHLAPAQWQQAARGLGHAGLGLRSVAAHAPAAYLASVGGCAVQCGELDSAYTLPPLDATLAFNAPLPTGLRLFGFSSAGQKSKRVCRR